MRNNYNTKQKKTVIEFFSNNTDVDYSVEELINYLAINKVTLYRILEQLVNSNILRKTYVDTKYVYQYVENSLECHNHLHLKCLKCGKVYHVDCDMFLPFTEHIKQEHSFIIDQYNSIIVGICAECGVNK
jgi:Fur family ferric uptake transcriptional regulator